MSVSAWSSAVTKMSGVSSERGRWRMSCAVSKPSVVAIRTVEERLTLADGQITAANQAVVEQPVGALLEVWAEVDEHVRADDEVKVVERSVGDQAVASPRDAVLQPQIEAGGAASDGVVVGQAGLSAGGLVRLFVSPDPFHRVGAQPGYGEHVLIEVGRVDVAALEESLFLQQDGKRIHLLAARAAGDPDSRRWIRPEEGDHLLAHAPHELRVAKHAGHVHAHDPQEPLHAARVVQDAILVGGDRAHALA